MRIAAIASIVMLGLASAGLAVAASNGSQTPKRVALTGKISVLKLKTITRARERAHLTCRITTTSPKVQPRGFALGSKVKITCVKGILSTIKRTPLVTAGARRLPRREPTADPARRPPGTGGVKIAPTVNGPGTISALGSGAIEFGGAITCQLTSSFAELSPPTRGRQPRELHAAPPARLTAISPSEADLTHPRYSGMLPCLRGGRGSRFVIAVRSASISTGRVRRGSITSST